MRTYMFLKAVCVGVLSLVPLYSSAELVTINPEQVFTWKVGDGYRAELEKLQDTSNVCVIELPERRERILAGAQAVRLLTNDQLVVIHKLHRQLMYDTSFREGVAALIEHDAADVLTTKVMPTEFGGLGIHVRGQIELLPIPNGGRLKLDPKGDETPSTERADSFSNGRYYPPEWAAEIIPYVFEWHMHSGTFSARSDICSPSAGYDQNLGWTNDVGYLLSRMKTDLQRNKKAGKAHGVLFTKMNHRMFSTVYYGGVMDKSGTWFITMVALPILEY